MDDEIWTTKDGTKLPVGQMTEEHVRNALRHVIKRARERKLAAQVADAPLPEDGIFDGCDIYGSLE